MEKTKNRWSKEFMMDEINSMRTGNELVVYFRDTNNRGLCGAAVASVINCQISVGISRCNRKDRFDKDRALYNALRRMKKAADIDSTRDTEMECRCDLMAKSFRGNLPIDYKTNCRGQVSEDDRGEYIYRAIESDGQVFVTIGNLIKSNHIRKQIGRFLNRAIKYFKIKDISVCG
jgi:hypothetical protein